MKRSQLLRSLTPTRSPTSRSVLQANSWHLAQKQMKSLSTVCRDLTSSPSLARDWVTQHPSKDFIGAQMRDKSLLCQQTAPSLCGTFSDRDQCKHSSDISFSCILTITICAAFCLKLLASIISKFHHIPSYSTIRLNKYCSLKFSYYVKTFLNQRNILQIVD